MAVLKVENLTKVFPAARKDGEATRALDRIDLEIGDHTFVSLVGPSGCGKSTFLNLLSEWFASTEGVGWQARYWYDANNFTGFVSWVVLFVGFIVIFDRLILVPIQNRVFRWRTTIARR